MGEKKLETVFTERLGVDRLIYIFTFAVGEFFINTLFCVCILNTHSLAELGRDGLPQPLLYGGFALI